MHELEEINRHQIGAYLVFFSQILALIKFNLNCIQIFSTQSKGALPSLVMQKSMK